MSEQSAKGLKGILLNTCHGVKFRVYNEDKTEFKDYNVLHCDMLITIEDDDAFIKEDKYIDYSNRTLGR